MMYDNGVSLQTIVVVVYRYKISKIGLCCWGKWAMPNAMANAFRVHIISRQMKCEHMEFSFEIFF